MDLITLKSPAKINLHLKVMGKRKNGYHNLVTIFHRISLCDTLTLRKRKSAGFQLSCNWEHIPLDERNIILKTWKQILKKFPSLKAKGLSVQLNKRIPAGAGLGGGSSNAAFFMIGVKKLFNLKWSKEEMLKMGAKIGADVPFFLLGKTQSLAWGIGDRFETLPGGKKKNFLIISAPYSLSTADVFKTGRFNSHPASLTKEKGVAKILNHFLNQNQLDKAADLQENDLQTTALKLKTSLKKIMSDLVRAGADIVSVTGSGPTLFAMSSNLSQLRRIKRLMESKHKKYLFSICQSY